jgi:hypothetical protein
LKNLTSIGVYLRENAVGEFIQMQTPRLLLLLLILPIAFECTAAQEGRRTLLYAYAAYDYQGLWVASGLLTVMALSEDDEESYYVTVSRLQTDLFDYQDDFRWEADFMQGKVVGKTIELRPHPFGSDLMFINAEFIDEPFGHFQGHWKRTYGFSTLENPGEFHAWPIGEP